MAQDIRLSELSKVDGSKLRAPQAHYEGVTHDGAVGSSPAL